MTNIERRDREMAYISDQEVYEQQKRARSLIQKLNSLDRSDFDSISATVRELLDTDQNAFINPPFYCDYGNHIKVGKNFFANYNCTILDVAQVIIGDNCLFAPNVSIYTAGHPLHPVSRNSVYEYGIRVTIGDNVWLGGQRGGVPWGYHRQQQRHRRRQRGDQGHPRVVRSRRKSLPGDPENHGGGPEILLQRTGF